jgi:hypothetical protein
MRLPLQLLLAILAVSTVFSLDITTRDGKTYERAKVTGIYPDGLSITHSTGVTKVPFENLPDAIQKEYNYDPAKVAASSKAADEAAKAAAQRERERIALRAEQEARRQTDQRRQQETRLVPVAEHSKDYTMILVIAIILIAIFVVVAVIRAKQQREREQRALLFKQARDFAATVQQNRALPIVPTNIFLKPGESAFYSTPSALYETRAARHYQAGHSGFRVAKGVYVGGTSGRSTSTQQWAKLDTGLLTITNKRLVFDGGKEDRTVPLSKIVSVNCSLTGIEVSVEGRQKTMVFDAANPLIASTIVRLCCQVSDPSNLSGDNINFQFQE